MSIGYLAVPVGASIMAVQFVLLSAMPHLMQRWSPTTGASAGAAD
jgi:hypothetical protein